MIAAQPSMKHTTLLWLCLQCIIEISGVEPQELGTGRRYFQGYESLQKEEQLLDLTGISYGTFDFLLERTLVPSDNCKFSQKNANPEIHN